MIRLSRAARRHWIFNVAFVLGYGVIPPSRAWATKNWQN